MNPPVYRVSIDTGGTFTDGFVTSGDRSAQIKVDTTPYDPTVGFGNCIAAAAEAMDEELTAFLTKTRMVHFSSTISTNVVVQRLGAAVGLVVTAGHEQDFYGTPQQAQGLAAFLPESAVRGVDESVETDGQLVSELDIDSLEIAVRELLEVGVQIIVISLANAHLNPANEIRARAIIDKSYPKHYLGAIPLVLSSTVSLEDDNYGRTALAVANAYIHPILARSLYRAEDLIRRDGFAAPLQIVNTDGSSARVAKTRAIDTYNSGPAAGTLGAAIVAEAVKADHVVTFDVGGTTTDVAYVDGGNAPRSRYTEFGPAAVPHNAVDIWSFGLGGGSFVTVGEDGHIAVGPQSAGAVPGPASFGLGGDTCTPTDLWLVLGYLSPDDFLSGRRRLDIAKAEAVIDSLATALGVSPDEAALAAYDAVQRAVGNQMLRWAERYPELLAAAAEDRWLYSYGGGGGLLAVHAAEALDIANVLVFPQSSVFSAFGGGLLPIAHEYQSAVTDIGDVDEMTTIIERLTDRAWRDLRAERVSPQSEVRASGQISAFHGDHRGEVSVGPIDTFADRMADTISKSGDRGVGKVTFRVEVARDLDLRVHLETTTNDSGASRTIMTSDGRVDVPVVRGLGTPNAATAAGPAFLDARDTTIFVPAGWDITFNDLGYGRLQRKQS